VRLADRFLAAAKKFAPAIVALMVVVVVFAMRSRTT
jgi:hypothetical protein